MLHFVRYSAGETIIILSALAMMFLIPFIIIGVVFFILRRNNKNRAVWNAIAKNLNFNMPNPKKLEMSGFYNGCGVKISVGARRSGGENSRTEFYTYSVTKFPHSLRFLLEINSPKGIISGIFGANQLQLGIPGFDQTFNAGCYDADVLRKLLISDFHSRTSRNLMEDLLLARQIGGIINITDKQIYIEKSGQVGDETVIRQMLDTTTYLANRFKIAREDFPLAEWEKQTFRTWREFSGENGFAFDSENIRMQGIYKQFPAFVALETEKGKWQTLIKFHFPQSLLVGLKIMPENAVHKALTWLGAQDIESGIREFDDAFIVKGKNLQVARHKLQPDFCRHLVSLKRQASEISIDDAEISVAFDTVLGDESDLKSHLEAVRKTAQMLMR